MFLPNFVPSDESLSPFPKVSTGLKSLCHSSSSSGSLSIILRLVFLLFVFLGIAVFRLQAEQGEAIGLEFVGLVLNRLATLAPPAGRLSGDLRFKLFSVFALADLSFVAALNL